MAVIIFLLSMIVGHASRDPMVGDYTQIYLSKNLQLLRGCGQKRRPSLARECWLGHFRFCRSG